MSVRLRHPTLPPEQEISVDDDAVPHYANAGWQAVPGEELQARAVAAAKASAAEPEAAAEPPVKAVPEKKPSAKSAPKEGGSD